MLAVSYQFETVFQFQHEVHYGQTIERLLQQGKYDRVNRDITSRRFPPKSYNVADCILQGVLLNQEVTKDKLEIELKEKKVRPAVIQEMLVLGAAHPQLQREYLIVALSSVFKDGFRRMFVPYLGHLRDNRIADLKWTGTVWEAGTCFLVVSL